MWIPTITLVFLSLAAFRYCGWPSISTIYNITWSISFVLIALNGQGFFPISDKMMACVVTIGFLAVCIDLITRKLGIVRSADRMRFHGHLKAIVILFLFGLPFFIIYIIQISDIGIDGNLLFRVRYATSQGGGRLGVLGLVALLSTFHAVTCLIYVKHIGKRWVVTALVVAGVMQILTAARTGLILLICASLVVIWIKNKKVSLATSFSAILIVAAVFIYTSSLRSSDVQQVITSNNSYVSSGQSLFKGLSLYLGSGPVAFSQVAETETKIAPDGYLWANFFSSLGLADKISSGILPYVNVPIQTNIYSMFLPYFAYGGWSFIIIVMVSILYVFSILFRYASKNGEVSVFVYSFGAAFLIQSPIGDSFVVGFPVWLQMFFYVCLVYFVLPSVFSRKGKV
jgi:oligosaccharide repeat unit polymerase